MRAIWTWAVLCCVGLAGCGGDDDSTATEDSKTAIRVGLCQQMVGAICDSAIRCHLLLDDGTMIDNAACARVAAVIDKDLECSKLGIDVDVLEAASAANVEDCAGQLRTIQCSYVCEDRDPLEVATACESIAGAFIDTGNDSQVQCF